MYMCNTIGDGGNMTIKYADYLKKKKKHSSSIFTSIPPSLTSCKFICIIKI